MSTELNPQVKEYFSQVVQEYSSFQGWDSEKETIDEFVSREDGLDKSSVLLNLSAKKVVVTLGDALEMSEKGITNRLIEYCWGVYEVAPGFLGKEDNSYILASIYNEKEIHFTVGMWREIVQNTANPFKKPVEDEPPTQEVEVTPEEPTQEVETEVSEET